MMTDAEMTDAEVADQIERADCFIEQLLAAITATVIDPASLCADAQRGGLQRIAATLDAVPFVTMCNLANLDKAMRGGLMQIIEVHLLAVGRGPALDSAHATAFLAGFETIIEKVRRRRLQ
jgi:hypothetical protein